MAVEPGQATAQDGLGLWIVGVARQGQAGGLGDWTPLKINNIYIYICKHVMCCYFLFCFVMF